MAIVKISEKTYWDKVMGCWYGKNAGGTLGGPLENLWGKEEPFNIDWYPVLQEGGMPNDDLEIQLIWLQALEDRGLDITCKDLAEYWLDCIWYNPDEYGLHKTNLRIGLQPPVSGWFNNFFKHCMGSPIRSEIWACIAPGLPHIAASYAWHDAVCDHAGGESVYGEIFNAAVESAAFLISDIKKLMEIGLAMIPPDCLTAKAIRSAIEAKESGLDWLSARKKVMEVAYSPIAQFSPINLGFQTIGLLYGEDFGDALCKAVNCGYDTDCTGATVGAILGIIMGASNLPKKWIEPLGNTIATNASWGGIRNVRLPKDLDELTERVIRIGKLVVARYGENVAIGEEDDFSEIEKIKLTDEEKAREIYSQPYKEVRFILSSLDAFVGYPKGPAVWADSEIPIELRLINRQQEPLLVEVEMSVPDDFTVQPIGKVTIELKPRGESKLHFLVKAPKNPGKIDITHRCLLNMSVKDRPAVESLPVVLVGARRWLVSEVYPYATLSTFLPPEEKPGWIDNPSGWRMENWPENELPVEPFFEGKPGVIYLRHFIKSPSDRVVRIGVPNSHKMKLWVNGALVKQTDIVVPLRPNYSGDGSNYADVRLKAGWNSILIKLERGDNPIEAHFTVAEPHLSAGQYDLLQTRFPWEE
ncbi:ADP-ribosylglycohydrolase family protein [bacterium]|nr:ADP-ribosylglycohydrolase family protein [bacterium]